MEDESDEDFDDDFDDESDEGFGFLTDFSKELSLPALADMTAIASVAIMATRALLFDKCFRVFIMTIIYSQLMANAMIKAVACFS